MERARKLGLDKATDVAGIHLLGYFLLGEPNEVDRIVAQVAGRPDEFQVTQFLAITQQFSGQYRKAAATFQRAFEQAGREKAPDVQAGDATIECDRRGEQRVCARATRRRCSRRLRWIRVSRSRHTPCWPRQSAVTASWPCPWPRSLSKKYPEDTLIQAVYQPLAKAWVALAEGRPQEAVDSAEAAKSFSAIYPGSYVQGLAYLQLHDAGHALSAFKAAMQSPDGQPPFAGGPILRAGPTGAGAGVCDGRRQGRTRRRPTRPSS